MTLVITEQQIHTPNGDLSKLITDIEGLDFWIQVVMHWHITLGIASTLEAQPSPPPKLQGGTLPKLQGSSVLIHQY